MHMWVMGRRLSEADVWIPRIFTLSVNFMADTGLKLWLPFSRRFPEPLEKQSPDCPEQSHMMPYLRLATYRANASISLSLNLAAIWAMTAVCGPNCLPAL